VVPKRFDLFEEPFAMTPIKFFAIPLTLILLGILTLRVWDVVGMARLAEERERANIPGYGVRAFNIHDWFAGCLFQTPDSSSSVVFVWQTDIFNSHRTSTNIPALLQSGESRSNSDILLETAENFHRQFNPGVLLENSDNRIRVQIWLEDDPHTGRYFIHHQGQEIAVDRSDGKVIFIDSSGDYRILPRSAEGMNHVELREFVGQLVEDFALREE